MQFDTRVVHDGQPNDPLTGAISFPIYQTSTFSQAEAGAPMEYMGRTLSYARSENPTRTALENAVASLEGGAFGLAFSSGLAAVNTALSLLSAGDHVVACRDLYGGSYRLFTKVYARFGVSFDFVDTTDAGEVERSLRPNTRLLWLESPSNPLLCVTDIAAVSAIARAQGVLTVVDNTFATPYLQNPLALGADVVVHSTTKYLNGHGDVIGGAIVTDDTGIRDRLKFHQNAAGAIPGPQDCFLVLRGLKTLSLRMERHCANAAKIASHLSEHGLVERVYYPGLPSHPGHAIARRQMRAFGGIVSFVLRAEVEASRRFLSRLRVFTLAESLGAVKSLACHPPSMTHASVEPEVRRAAGVADGLIRLSVGIEDAADLVDDLDRALEGVPAGTRRPRAHCASTSLAPAT